MAIQQISVFVQNEKGALNDVLRVLADANVEIRALSIADTKDFGILRLITDNNAKAELALAENHYVSTETAVIGAEVADRPGGLSALINTLAEKDIEVEYLYAFVASSKEHAYVVLRVNDNVAAEAVLLENGIELLTEDDIANI